MALYSMRLKAWKLKLRTNRTNILYIMLAGTKSIVLLIDLGGYNTCLLMTVNVFHSWDEWVPESRVLKLNEQAILKQKELLKAHEAAS